MKNLKSILENSDKKELQGLADILGADDIEYNNIINTLQKYSSSLFHSDLRKYDDIVKQVARKLSINFERNEKTAMIETKISQKVFKTMLEKLSEDEKEKLEQKLLEASKKFDKSGALAKSASIISFLTTAQLSGFGVYLLASTSLSALSSVIGVTLPFAVYSTMSSAISVIIGPVGWLGAGLFVIWKLTAPNYKKLIPAIVYINMLRYQHELGINELAPKSI